MSKGFSLRTTILAKLTMMLRFFNRNLNVILPGLVIGMSLLLKNLNVYLFNLDNSDDWYNFVTDIHYKLLNPTASMLYLLLACYYIPFKLVGVKLGVLLYIIIDPFKDLIFTTLQFFHYNGFFNSDSVEKFWYFDIPLLTIVVILVVYKFKYWNYTCLASDKYNPAKVQLCLKAPNNLIQFLISIQKGYTTGKHSILYNDQETTFRKGHIGLINIKHHYNPKYKYMDIPLSSKEWNVINEYILLKNSKYSIIRGYHCASEKIWNINVSKIVRDKNN